MSEVIRARLHLARGGFALDAEFSAPGRGVTALAGPSGCGKTTLLRCLAGLERARPGRVEALGEVWQDEAAGVFIAPHLRGAGFVFQESNLFPHLSVRGNLAFGLGRTPAAARIMSLDQAVGALRLEALIDRRCETLSAGQRQRVAIARALLAGPRLLLMDEPLANLDAEARGEALELIESLTRRLTLPVIYVTHQIEEAVRLSDHLVLMDAGRVTAGGPLVESLARLDLPLARFDDAGAALETVIAGHDETYHLTELSFAGGRLFVPRQERAAGVRLRVRIPARDVSLALDPPVRTSILNVIPGVVAEIAEDGATSLLVRLDCGGTALLARVTRRSAGELGLAPGTRVHAQIKSVALMRQG